MRECKVTVKNSVIALSVVSSLLFASSVSAETKEEVQSQRSEVQADIGEKEQEIEEIKTELVELNEKILRLDEAIEDNEKEIDKTKNQIEKAEQEISDLEAEIAEIEEDMEQRNEILKERISSLQENGGSKGYLEVVLGADNFIDMIDRVSKVNKITNADKELLEKQEADKIAVEENKKELDEKLADLEDSKAEYEEMQEQIVAQKDENEELKVEWAQKEEENSDILADLHIEDQVLANKEQALKEAEEAEAERQRLAEEQAAANAENEESSNESNESSEESSDNSSNSDSQASEESSSSKDKKPEVKTASAPAPSGGGIQTIMNAGKKYIGNSVYVFGGGRSSYDIANGRFDCSGFVSWAFKQGGINLPASTAGQSSVGSKVSPSDMQPGDLVFFNTYKTNGHVGIYLGNNKFIGSQSSSGVAIADMGSGYWAQKFSGHVRRVAN
ncbi:MULTISPECIES: C40 family peptidase [Gracilibacillus]|uniref:C40 family peptidase n=1 Tax=Gracilibacillus TaxID=74385 RepID=UPI000826C395|nr:MULTISPECIES: C40 family peptidase [Gracilibacillus]